ncbi:MAG TPA: hypothetical protein VFF69_07990 [Phycisphaerales bacterium]|nr:hypothetical protein [Phycisphaerales bacterium]
MSTRMCRASAVALAIVPCAGAAAQVEFVPLGELAGGERFSKATGVSDDGRYVGGGSIGSGAGLTPVRWHGTTPEPLALPPGFDLGAEVNDISGDGMWVVGMGPGPSAFVGLRWEPDGTPVITGDFAPPGWSSANSINGDGSVITGFGGLGFLENTSEMFRWTPGAGEEPLGDLAGGDFFSNGTAVSNDGAVLGGYATDALGPRPVNWTGGVGFSVLATPDGGSGLGRVLGLSHDGLVSLGEAEVGGAFLPARWQAGEGEVLGAPPLGYSTGHAIASNADGSLAVGIWRENEFSDELGSIAFIWDEAHGARLLADALLSDYGLDTSGWTLNMVTDMTPGGTTLVGYGLNPEGDFQAFKIVVPGPGGLAVLLAGAAGFGRRVSSPRSRR